MKEGFATRITGLLAEVPSEATGALVVRTSAIGRNYARLKEMAPAAETAAVVKADAYGLGVHSAVPALEAAGCKTFFVATLNEAKSVRCLSKQAVIYVLDGLLPGTAAQFANISARPVLGSIDEIAEWGSFCTSEDNRYPAAVHVDSGMTRLGLSLQDCCTLARSRDALSRFELSLLMSHLACADEPENLKNEKQRAAFAEAVALIPGVSASLANSAGVFLGPAFHFDVTRPGIFLYGGRPRSIGANPAEPVVSLFGRIAQIRWAKRGDTVGYGGTYTLKRRSKIVTVSVGYADGYFRSLSAADDHEGPKAWVGEHALPLIGRVSMDLSTYDATNVPDALLQRGGFVEILGERVTVDDLAGFAGTIGYEVLTSLGGRYHRIYVDE